MLFSRTGLLNLWTMLFSRTGLLNLWTMLFSRTGLLNLVVDTLCKAFGQSCQRGVGAGGGGGGGEEVCSAVDVYLALFNTCNT